MTKKLAIIVTHPIQYYAPVFKLIAKKLELKVFYTAGDMSLNNYDHGFKKKIEWDIPLLNDYNYEFLENTSKSKGSHHFKGIVNPDAIQQIKEYQPDAILIYGWAYKSHLKIIRYFKNRIPIYFRGDSTILDHQSNFRSILRPIFLKWVYSHVDKAFYVGNANKSYFKKYGLKEHQLIFAPHAIDNERFIADRKQEAELIRKEFGIKSEDIIILFAGKLEQKKNPDLLLEAFIEMTYESEIQRQKSEVKKVDILSKGICSPLIEIQKARFHLLFVGNGELEKSLKYKTASLNLKNIHFLDFQNQTQMPAIYQSCDLFCLPSKGPGETWGLAVNEAMAAGKAVIVSNKVGCGVDLVNSENGKIFQSGNLKDLTEKLIALTNDKEALNKMGENSLKHIQDWSFNHQVKSIVNYVNR